MKTTRTISTISFNTKEFLILKLNELKKSKIISFYCFIEHLPEDDEGGKKNHIHLFIEPAKSIQTEDLREQLQELDLTNSKPLGVLPFNYSKIDDWLLYAIHDKTYLASKNESRKYHYQFSDIITCDADYLNYNIKKIDITSLTPLKKMYNFIENGFTFVDFLNLGNVPIQQINQFRTAWDMILNESTFRNNRQNHDIDYKPNNKIQQEQPKEQPSKNESSTQLKIIDDDSNPFND